MSNIVFDYKVFRKHVVDMSRASKMLKKETRRMKRPSWDIKKWRDDPEVVEYLQASVTIMQDLLEIVENRVHTVKKDLSDAQSYIHMGDKVSNRLAIYVTIKIYWNILLGIIIGYLK